jgi:GTPase SAR1 family protein
VMDVKFINIPKGAQACLTCFDVTNKTSFESVTKWLQELDRYAPENIVIVLVTDSLSFATNQQLTLRF